MSVILRNSFRPERVLFRPDGVNHQDYLCGVQSYASAQSLDFLARTKNPRFPNRKRIVSGTLVRTRNPKPAIRNRHPGGFTLLELLVAMSLLVIVVAALYSTYFALMQGRDTAVAGMESRRELRGTLDLMRREITSAIYASGDKKLHFIVEDRDVFGKPASNLDFTTLSPPRSGSQPQSDQVAVAYRTVAQDGRLTLIRQAKDVFLTPDPVPYPQVEELEGFLVECLNGDKWIKSWDTQLNHGLPMAVKITLRVKEGDKTVDYVTIASPKIPVT